LSSAEKEIWTEIVNKVRPGWFWSSETLLEIYVRVVAHERLMAGWMRKTRITNSRYVDLQKMRRDDAMLASALATKLRLTPRSTIDRSAPKLVSSQRKPWEEDEPA
jgi:hypothetical protein